MSSLLEMRNIDKRYDGPAVLSGLSMSVSAGERVSIRGVSGSGKSTLLYLAAGLETADAGEVLLNQTSLAGLSDRAISSVRAQKIGFVFQDHHLLGQCTVRENVLLPTIAAGHSGSAQAADRADSLLSARENVLLPTIAAGHSGSAQAADRADSLLSAVGLGDRFGALPGELSGGQRQRVAVVRALINEPPLLLVDEPTGNLDAHTAGELAELLFGLADQQGAAMVLVTHDADLARRCETQYTLHEGRLER